MLSLPRKRPQVNRHSSSLRQVVALSVLLVWATVGACQAQARSVLCTAGDGVLDVEFRTGIKLHVGAARSGELANRSCAAKLSWDKQDVVIAASAAQLDVDAFGVNLGDGIPVAAFQIRKLDSECCMKYAIYSLEKPPRLLRTITGGDFFSASDVDLEGRVEIWTNDAASVNGFEGLTLSELDSAPTVVLRFANGQLLDVSAEFQSYFDDEIAKLRAGIRPQDLEDFKASDGKLVTPSTPAAQLHHCRLTKIKVLEIVWAYLYSGREDDAWRSLAEMWPPADLNRIRTALVNARSHGIRSQIDGTASGPQSKKKHAPIFDVETRSGLSHKLEFMPPRAILLRRPPPPEIQQRTVTDLKSLVDLVVDEAGKVRSAELAGKANSADPDLIQAALSWKFIPAFKDGRPVACRVRLGVGARQ
jgi:hypothetical protein